MPDALYVKPVAPGKADCTYSNDKHFPFVNTNWRVVEGSFSNIIEMNFTKENKIEFLYFIRINEYVLIAKRRFNRPGRILSNSYSV